MAVCSPNPFNFTITWITLNSDTQSDLFRRGQDDYLGGFYGDYLLKEAFLDEPE